MRRPRGRPKGSKNFPKLELRRTVFAENQLEAGELVARSLLESLVVRSARHHAPVLSAVIGDRSQWRPTSGTDSYSRTSARLCTLYGYAESRDALLAFAEALRSVEGVAIESVALMRAGLALVSEFVALPRPVGAVAA